MRPPPKSPLFPYTTLFRSGKIVGQPLFRMWGAVTDRVEAYGSGRSEEHTSELQSLTNLVCRLLLEKKNTWHRLTEETMGRKRGSFRRTGIVRSLASAILVS